MQRILVVDDDHLQVDVVTFLLRRAEFEVSAAFDAPTAKRLFDEHSPDLVILDIQLGQADGRDLLQQFRSECPGVSILMLTALGAEDDRVRGLELGADDYLVKPFGHREFMARVRAVLRRSQIGATEPAPPRPLQAGPVVLDPMTHEVTRAGRRVELTPTEFRLLQTLMQRPGTLVPTRVLLQEVWGHQDMTARNVVRVTASRLRAKLEDPLQPPLVHTVPGEGLMLREPPAVGSAPHAVDDAPVVALGLLTDLQELLDQSDTRSLREISDAFAAGATEQLSAMRAALDNQDAPRLADYAHRLRGSSATLGAQRVATICASIEQQCRAGTLDGIGAVLPRLEQEVSAFTQAIDRL